MSKWIKNLLGGGSGKSKEVTAQEGITRLREVEDMLMKKSDFLEKKIANELANAKKNAKTNKRSAMMALKRKKRFEKQLQQIDGTLSTIEFQRESLENATTNTEVFKVMGMAAKALKSAHNDLDIDKVHDLMDDIADQNEIANEISEAISSPVSFGQDVDEDELLAELDELEEEEQAQQQEDLDRHLLDVAGPSVELPSVPTAEPTPTAATRKKAAPQQEDDDEMAELAAWAS